MNHISIEGMDGVGKSTTCKLLGEKLGYEFVEKPMHFITDPNSDDLDNCPNYFKVRDIMNSSKNKFLSSWFYALGTIYMYEKYKDSNIITDRHLLSNFAWSGADESQKVFDLMAKTLSKPKLTVILYARPEAIKSRLISRDINDSDIKKINQSETIYKKMISFCEQYNFPYLLIDSSNMKPEDVVQKIINRLEEC